MRKRKGFTLIELLIAVLIFGFMLTSMATIYSTANKHMFQNYRENNVKTQLTNAMKLLKSRIITATRIDLPPYGSDGNVLAFASNVDRSGCYPINPSEPVIWHYFCVANNNLYYHTGPIIGGAGCPGGVIWNPNSVYSFVQCNNLSGTLRGETVLLVAQNVNTSLSPVFSRRADSIGAPLERNVVRVRLRVLWTPPVGSGYDLRQAARTIDASIDTSISASMSAQ